MLLCRGVLSGTDVIVQICCSKLPKALMLRCRGALFSFQFWDRKQNLVPNVWQVLFVNVSIEGRVVDSDVNSFFDVWISIKMYKLLGISAKCVCQF